jgi:hypothetical protein
MTVVARRVAATPARSASEAWSVIVNLIAPSDDAARKELQSIEGVASCIIAEETMTSDACVVHGSGPRLRVYCLYNEDAITGESVNEAPLTFSPTDGEWRMSLPCLADDLDWVQKALKERSEHVVAREVGTAVDDEESEKSTTARGAVINREAFLRS